MAGFSYSPNIQTHNTESLDLGPVKSCSHPRIDFLILPNPPHLVPCIYIFGHLPYPSTRHLLNSLTTSSNRKAFVRQGKNLRSFPLAYSCPAVSAHLPLRDAATCLPHHVYPFKTAFRLPVVFF